MSIYICEDVSVHTSNILVPGEMDKTRMKQNIIQAANSIRRKYLALKTNRNIEDEAVQKLFRPITTPLKELSEKSSLTKSEEQEIKSDDRYYKDEKILYEPPKKKEKLAEKLVTTTKPVEDDVFTYSPPPEKTEQESSRLSLSSIQDEYRKVRNSVGAHDAYMEQYPPLVRTYIDGLYRDTTKKYDTTYGVRHDPAINDWKIGDKRVKFIKHNNEEFISFDSGLRKFKSSDGLYQLLFLNTPKEYSDEDIQNYKELMKYTNALRKDYKSSERFLGSRAYKWVSILKPLTQSTSSLTRSIATTSTRPKSFSGNAYDSFIEYNDKPVEYVYWDDINELVDRLRLLNAAKSAGNSYSLNGEILSIIEELREVGIIY